jgi:hypothetical protein
MTDEQKALSRRAVACKGWRWMPGMNALGRLDLVGGALRVHGVGRTSVGVELQGGAFDWRQRTDGRWLCLHVGDVIGSPCEVLPDLSDPATLGCLLALVREAWRCPTVYTRQSTVRRVSDGALAWEVCDLYLDAEACRALGVPREGSVGSWGHGSEAEALVAALEAAP